MQGNFRESIENSYSRKLPFVVYSDSGSYEVTGIFQKNAEENKYSDGDKGFIFAPFSSEGHSMFLPLEQSEIHTATAEKPVKDESFSKVKPDPVQKRSHIELVEDAIKYIHSSEVEKVVVSRMQQVTLRDFNLIELLKELFRNNINAFRYAWYHPQSGLWVGATPEVLITVSNNRFKTMSLAGTRVSSLRTHKEWTAKEYHEQQVVTDSIARNLESFSESMNISDVRTVRAGNLDHLRSDIEGKLRSGYSWLDLAMSLHPTPAVCGSPKDRAMEFILKREGYNRAYYTGYLGPVNVSEKRTDVYVNLRCMKIHDNCATIYTGGGITRDSDPTAEWEETCNKQQTMLKLLSQFL